MKPLSHLLTPSRLALFALFSLVLAAVLVIGMSTAVSRDNCCPLVRPTAMGWLTSPLYNPWPVSVVVGLAASVWYIGAERRKTDLGYLLLSFILALLLSMGTVHIFILAGTYANVMLDNGPPQTYHSQVIEKWADPSGPKLPTRYFMIVIDWGVERGEYVEVRVSFDAFRIIEVGNSIQVITQSGFLGHEWLSQIEPD